MATTEATITTSMSEVVSGLTLKVRMPREMTLRLRLGAWLIGLAGRVINVPVEVEMRDDGIRVGDVVRDRFDQKLMTVDYRHGDRANCVWFDGALLHRGTFPLRSLMKVDDQAQR